MVSVKGAGIKSALYDEASNMIELQIENPEHLLNDIVAGVGMFAPPFNPYEKADDAEIKKSLISHADSFFEVYGEKKPSDELGSRYSPSPKSEDVVDLLEEVLAELTLAEVAESVVDAVDEDRLSVKDALSLAAKYSKEPISEIKKATKKALDEMQQKQSLKFADAEVKGTATLIGRLAEALNEIGEDFEIKLTKDYSGRGMMGKECPLFRLRTDYFLQITKCEA
jgi:hypothetical protein